MLLTSVFVTHVKLSKSRRFVHAHVCSFLEPRLRMIMVALCNDHHFWGLETAASADDDQDHEVVEYPCSDTLEEVWHDDSVSKQLGLIECLQVWDPWAVPTATLIEKFEAVSSTGRLTHGAAVFKARQFALYQLTREQSAYEEFLLRLY